MDFLALVVIYNQSCENSLTCQGLQQCGPDIRVAVYDNSTRDCGNRAYCAAHGWDYYGGTGNVGLSKAYNCVIDAYIAEKPNGILCLFDDDSQVPADYFQCLSRAAEEKPDSMVFAPILLLEDGRVLSPSVLNPKTGAVRLFDTPEALEQYQGGHLTAMNSGMAIRLEIFRDYRYDEGLFLDCVDDRFLMDLGSRNQTVQVLSCPMVHHLSSYSKEPLDSALRRFLIFAKDVDYCYRANRYAYYRLLSRRTLRLTWEYKSLAFVKGLWKMRG